MYEIDNNEMEFKEHTDSGYVILARDTYKKSKTWQALNPIQKVVMITLVILANHKDGEWWDGIKKEWVPVKRGQLITSLDKLKKACGKGVSIQNIRTCFVNLEKMGFLTYQSTKQYRLVTLANYDFYQTPDNYLTKQPTKHQQSTNKAPTINNNGNKVNNEKKKYTTEFESFWAIYPRKTEKAKAFRVWQARINEGHTAAEMETSCKHYAATTKDTDQKYIKHASTFIGPDKPFEDYLKPPKPPKPKYKDPNDPTTWGIS